uniref:5'-3' DNA helicase ZGRF1-like N-terminal domain-containing protein n=1 Tax=Kalanchoe fedtschenkoi TaxID=63787 RepID=A0A7N0UTV2_KALFE
MEEVKRWSVTYTKHIKQKRKVYQDGFLAHHTGSRKAMLYDSRRNLLDCRFLKSDDVVKSGESLSFDGHIVDIGEPEVDKKPQNDISGNVINTNFVKESSKSQRLKKLPKANTSKDTQKDGSIAKLSDNTNSNFSNSEWFVLYTSQLIQKAKKFHDGYLSLAHFGSQGRKVMLYDASRRLLDSRFLKRDEHISSDETLYLDGHLVNIGEPKNVALSIKLVTQMSETITASETGDTSAHQGFVQTSETLVCNKNVANLSTAYGNPIKTTSRIPFKEATLRGYFQGHNVGSLSDSSLTDKNSSSKIVPTNKPLNDGPFSKERSTPSGLTSSAEHRLNHSQYQKQPEERPVEDTHECKAVLGIKEDVTKAFDGGLDDNPSNRTATLETGAENTSLACTKSISADGFEDSASESTCEFNTRPKRTASLVGLPSVDSAKNLIEETEMDTSLPRSFSSANGPGYMHSKETFTMLSSTEVLTCYSNHILERDEVDNFKKDVGVESWPSNESLEPSVVDNSQSIRKSIGDMDACPSFSLGFQ